MKIPPNGITCTELAAELHIDQDTARCILNAAVTRQGLVNGGVRNGEAIWVGEEPEKNSDQTDIIAPQLCPHCGGVVGVRKKWAIFCSQKCQKGNANRQYKAKKRELCKLRESNPKGGNFPK